MDPARELVDAAQVGTALAVLSSVSLLLAALFFVGARARPSAALTRAALVASLLALLYPLWLVYNGIEDYFGLDSVAALLINLVLFVLVGIGIGLLFRRVWPING